MHALTVDIVLPVLNAAAILPGTLDSLRAQTSQDFRVVVVDGGSTDGSLDLIARAADVLNLDVVSEPDHHLSEALSKGLARAHADVVGILSADERYEPYAVERAVDMLSAHPAAIAVSGTVEFLEASSQGASERVVGRSATPPFSLSKHLACEVVWPVSATFFNRRVLQSDLHYDTSAATCPDYELWGRLGFRYPAETFLVDETPVSRVFRSSVSMSFRPDAFPQMVHDKLHYLHSLEHLLPPDQRPAIHRASVAGIHMWAAEQMFHLDAPSSMVIDQCVLSYEAAGMTARLHHFLERTRVATHDPVAMALVATPSAGPPEDTSVVSANPTVRTAEHWVGAHVAGDGPWVLTTANDPWGYSAEISFPETAPGIAVRPAWIEVDVEVMAGAVGAGLSVGGHLIGEVVVTSSDGRRRVTFSLSQGDRAEALLRSGGRGYSQAVVHAARVLVPRGHETG